MNNTSFGQIEIYNNYFKDLNKSTIKHSPTECIERKLSYCGIYNNRELPIMIGSKFSSNDNPLKINGYFIIDGICKSVNNIKIKEKMPFSKDRSYLNDGSRIDIHNMFKYTITFKGKSKQWRLPINWKEIIKFSSYKKELDSHLGMISKYNKNDKAIKNESDLISLCYMFESWLDLRTPPTVQYRLVTAGELIKDIIDRKEDVIKCFRNNTWPVKYIQDVYTVSEDMKHHNIISDIESIRRITIPTQRENISMENRMVKLEDKYKICPVQTSDGALCGTVMYLTKHARITNNSVYNEQEEGYIYTYLNSKYIGKMSMNYINKMEETGSTIINYNKVCLIFNMIGRIIKGDTLISYTASFIPYRTSNPPVRSMFVCAMIKQAITEDSRLHIINNTKILIKGDQPTNSEFPTNFGHSLNVAIMPWYGYNIEDAIVISKTTSEKFRSKKYIIHRETTKKVINKYVKIGDIINKFQELYRTYDPSEIKTIETTYSNDNGIVKEIIHKENYFKLVITKTRNIEVGDKMSSRHGQKGVVSLIELDKDMPFYYKNGIKCIIDLIINPHAFPSRMTIGQIKEMMENGDEIKLNNCENKILVGKCFYMALRHQVEDKIQYREDGDIDIITKQPVYGKKNIGGLRLGQMERDILIGVGAWETIKELWSIDKTIIYVCPISGKINTTCCREIRDSHQYFKICLSYLRALSYDILLKGDRYSIVKINLNDYPKTNSIIFGDLDTLDTRVYKDILMLPLCLRSIKLSKLYDKARLDIKEIEKEIKRLLKSKKGAYHKLVEGHRINSCARSVIVPNPKLELDTIEVPLGVNIGTNYGILNRQPSLNVSSMIAVKLVQSKNKTIGLNPLLCKSFNADFDGDEMNIYGLKNKKSFEEVELKLKGKLSKTQDYILIDYLKLNTLEDLTKLGLTANKQGIELMIKSGSKGKPFNMKHMFEEIGEIIIGGKIIGEIKNNYWGHLTEDEWYLLSMAARESAASIGVNTPITGYLESICNQMYI